MGDYNDAFMRGKDAAVQARTKAQNRATVLQLKLIGQSHPTGLTSNLLKLFEPRPPLEYKPPPEKRKCPPYSGIAQFVSGFAKPGEPKYAPPVVKGETPTQKRARIHKQRLEDGALKAATELQNYDPSKDPNLSGDPYKTLFVARLSYETTEHRIKRDFEVYGPIKRVRLVTDQNTNKPRGYAFIEYIHTRDMKTAYKQADGKKIDNRRVLVDVERGRTVPNWRPRRLGGGLGSTRIGGEGMNQKFSGREPQQITAGGARRSEEPRVREDRRDREVSRERGRDREREKSRERSHERGRDRDAREDQHHRDRDRNRDRDRERDRDRNRDHDRERDRDRDRSHRTRDHDRGRDRDRERDQDRDHERDRRRERERGYEHGEFDRDYERSREREDEYGKKVEPDHGYDGEFKQSEHNHDPVWYGHGERGEAYNLTEKDHSHEEGYEKGEIGRNGGELSRDREGEYNYADGPEYEQ